MFTQLEKVGKNQAAQKEGLAAHQVLQNVQMQRKTEEQIQSVNEARDAGEGAEKVNDRGSRQSGGEDEQEDRDARAAGGDDEAGEVAPAAIRDPALGRNVDISG
jgi:hypothetical protein